MAASAGAAAAARPPRPAAAASAGSEEAEDAKDLAPELDWSLLWMLELAWATFADTTIAATPHRRDARRWRWVRTPSLFHGATGHELARGAHLLGHATNECNPRLNQPHPHPSATLTGGGCTAWALDVVEQLPQHDFARVPHVGWKRRAALEAWRAAMDMRELDALAVAVASARQLFANDPDTAAACNPVLTALAQTVRH